MPNPFGRKPLALVGRTFGKLLAIRVVGSEQPGGRIWECLCDCGATTTAFARQLTTGGKKSCGCLKREHPGREVKHGRTARNSGAYRAWNAMRLRCHRKDLWIYQRYGGRGITICERWNDFRNFLADVGEKPPCKTLGRINNDGNYEPGNCRWETPKEQARNRSTARMVEYRGEARCLAEWCDVLGKSRDTLKYRLKHGMDLAA